MKVSKLNIEYDYDFDVYGLTSSIKDYKLAWLVNNATDLQLSRVEDHHIENEPNSNFAFSNFIFKTSHNIIRLLGNKSYKAETLRVQTYLIPELKHFDYLLLKQGIGMEDFDERFITKIKEINGLDYVLKIDISQLKSKNNLLF